ncbi:MAG TPA: iron ABC transporter permease [Bacilli bacterium]|nr:iron ABC transporter permease [Bacilli bacterium]
MADIAMQTGRRDHSRSAFCISLILFFLLLLVSITAATLLGVKNLTWDTLPQALSYNPDDVLSYTVWHVRIPRALLGAVLGGGLAVAGALLQAVTRNPLSDPEIMGVNQGASFFVVVSLLLFGLNDITYVVLIAAFLGAAVGGSVVYGLAFQGDYSPVRLVLAGIAVSFFLGSMTTGFIVLNETDLVEILYWMAGKLSGATWVDLRITLMGVIPATLAALLLANQFNILSLGEETARGLGQNVARIRRLTGLLVILLVGGAVAVAGPIGFVGLMVPHMARGLVGGDYKRILPVAALIGANLLVLADLIGQWMLYPTETPVGIVTALLGTPFFLYLLRRKRGAIA